MIDFDDASASIAARVAARFARRYRSSELDDLEQQAWVAVLEVKQQRPPDEFEDVNEFSRIAWTAAVRQVQGHVDRQRSPVSAAQKKVKALRGTAHAIDHAIATPHNVTPERLVGDLELLVGMELRVRALLPVDELTEWAVECLFYDVEPCVLARTQQERRELYRRIALAKRRACTDAHVREFAEGLGLQRARSKRKMRSR